MKNETVQKALVSPAGSTKFCQNVIEPNTRWDSDGKYEAKLLMDEEDPETQAFMKKLDDLAQKAYDIETKEMKPGQRKKVGMYVPYETEEDDEGEPTGKILFKAKGKAGFKTKGGQYKSITLPVFDTKSKKPIDTEGIYIGNGSIGKFSCNAITFLAHGNTTEAGITLRLTGFQIIELAGGSSSDADSLGFDTDGSGFVRPEEKEEEDPFDADSSADTQESTDGDF